MITNQHNDGGCFKLTVNYPVPAENGPDGIYVMYGDDPDELWEHYKQVRHLLNAQGSTVTIKADSK